MKKTIFCFALTVLVIAAKQQAALTTVEPNATAIVIPDDPRCDPPPWAVVWVADLTGHRRGRAARGPHCQCRCVCTWGYCRHEWVCR